MSTADSVNYKGYLSANNEVEVRRFMVDKSAATSYEYLLEKVKAVFPAVRNKILKLTWTDEDKDEVTISGDEDLMIALTEMSGPVYKININVKDVTGNNNSTAGPNVEQGEEHPGVQCDGCEGPVRGYRYKCLVCPDYDLCSVCEQKGIHSGHNMVRMSSAQGNWPHHLFRKINRMQERMEKREKERTEKCGSPDEKREQPGFCGPRGRGARPWGGRGWGGRGWGMGNRCGFGAMNNGGNFEQFFGGATGAGANSTQTNANTGQQQGMDAKAMHEAAHAAAVNASQAAAAVAAAFGGNVNEHQNDYLRNVGQAMAMAMDPFGINVDVSIETPEGVRTKVASSSATSATTSTKTTTAAEEATSQQSTTEAAAASDKMETGGDQQQVMTADTGADQQQVMTADTGDDQQEAMTAETVDVQRMDTADVVEIPILRQDDEQGSKAGSSKASTPDEDEWTIVKDDNKKEGLYPELPVQAVMQPTEAAGVTNNKAVEQQAVAEEPKQEASHPDPRIQIALQAMMNMGFSNEGGWLTTLLEAKQGDIGKVLDLLQPVKK